MLTIRLLGPPAVLRDGAELPAPRGRKCWALLAYIALTDRPPSRQRVAGLLFSDAKDPFAALRWSLGELRRATGCRTLVRGDPLELASPVEVELDVRRLLAGELPEGTGDLLEGVTLLGAAGFDLWLDSQRRRLSVLVQVALRDRALANSAAGRHDDAVRAAEHAVETDPFEPLNHEVLQRVLLAAGREGEAQDRFAHADALFRRELDVSLPDSMRRAGAAAPGARQATPRVGLATEVRVDIEAGEAAVAVGAISGGLDQLRHAATLAGSADVALAAEAQLALGRALVHTGHRGADELAMLHRALELGAQCGRDDVTAQVAYELAYVSVQRGELGSGTAWLARAARNAGEDGALLAQIENLRGMAASDRGSYGEAMEALGRSCAMAEQSGRFRQAAYSLSLIGRVRLLRGELDEARSTLEECEGRVRAERWTAFLPWPQSMLGEVLRQQGRLDDAVELLERAFALGTHVGDACWVVMSARGLAQAYRDRGDGDEAVEWARRSVQTLPPYVWVHGYALDGAAGIERLHDRVRAIRLVRELADIAGRAGMRELTARAALHLAELGEADLATARWLSQDVDNPVLGSEIDLLGQAGDPLPV